MANALVVPTIRHLFENVKSMVDATERIAVEFGFKDDLQKLRTSILMLQALFADAERISDGRYDAVLWLMKLEEVAFAACRVLDKLHYETLRQEVESRNQQVKRNKVRFFLSFFKNCCFRWRMASEIRDILGYLRNIDRDAMKFGMVIRQEIEALRPSTVEHRLRRWTGSIVPPNVVGRANDERRIVEMLLTPFEEVFSVIPIVGMAGLGKTTLAQLVYNNPQIDLHFDKKIWICVGRCENLDLLKLILESLRYRRVEMSSREAILQGIREVLEGKRYLLVLDDVWDHEIELLENIFSLLKGINVAKGSCCLLTTRLEQVADAVTRHLRMNVGPYKLGKLTDDECWSIIEGIVVGGEEIPQELEAIAEELIKRCSGLPLTARVFGVRYVENQKNNCL